ncbi:hypothetical protein PINS_up021711 [Pythium insidiosum]|nr:hypothetical protein PINS_up021711 [Pythium insidiosum]
MTIRFRYSEVNEAMRGVSEVLGAMFFHVEKLQGSRIVDKVKKPAGSTRLRHRVLEQRRVDVSTNEPYYTMAFAALSKLILDYQLQEAAFQFCKFYEYRNGGVAPTVCGSDAKRDILHAWASAGDARMEPADVQHGQDPRTSTYEAHLQRDASPVLSVCRPPAPSERRHSRLCTPAVGRRLAPSARLGLRHGHGRPPAQRVPRLDARTPPASDERQAW